MKKVFATLVLVLFAVSAWASYDGEIWHDKSSGIIYELDYDNRTVRVYEFFNGGTVVTIPETIKIYNINFTVDEICASAFANHNNITSITIQGNKLTKIGETAFVGTSITSMTLPSSVTSIGYGAFISCNELKTVVLPDNLNRIESSLFSFCDKLESVKMPSKLAYIEHDAFSYCYALKSIVIPDAVTELPWSVFGACTSLENVTLPNKLTVIGEGAFGNCTKLKNINFPSTLRVIGEDAFYNCNFEKLVIPEGVTEIQNGAFDNNLNLATLVLPKSIKTMGNMCADCDKLRYVYCRNTEPIVVGPESFMPMLFGDEEMTLFVPRGTVDLYKDAYIWSFFSNIVEEVKGDVDGSGDVDVADVNRVIDQILGVGEAKYEFASDVTGDGIVDVADLNKTINIILSID